jgi:hypothetical protein
VRASGCNSPGLLDRELGSKPQNLNNGVCAQRWRLVTFEKKYQGPHMLASSLHHYFGCDGPFKMDLPISASRRKKLTDSGLESSYERRCISVVVLVKSFADAWKKLNLAIRYLRHVTYTSVSR